jgi:5-methylcytosine-specific restriction endonuclease McrA
MEMAVKHCYYCGILKDALCMTEDHFISKFAGGSNERRNIVPACNICNSIKGNRSVQQMRYRLILRKIGWPKFTHEQLDWLRAQGFDMLPYDTAKLWFEEYDVPRVATLLSVT